MVLTLVQWSMFWPNTITSEDRLAVDGCYGLCLWHDTQAAPKLMLALGTSSVGLSQKQKLKRGLQFTYILLPV
jgi:hypothetical protein